MARRPLLLTALLLATCSKQSGTNNALHVPSPAWEEQVVYFVMTDRFANGDKTNDDQHRGELDPASGDKYSGGDLQGVIDKLDYIQGMGATAVWITPPVANMWWDPLQQSGGYHGYWARDLKKVDEHLGTLDTYKALSRALHARGMYLIQDVVPNHLGNFFQYSSYDPNDPAKGVVRNTQAAPGSKPEQPPFDQNDVTDPVQRAAAIYHWTPAINDYADPNQEVNYQVSDLDDLNTENPAVRKALRDSYGYWIREVGVDAFRVDTVKYVPHDFWHDFFWSTDVDVPGILAVAKATGRDRFHAFGEVYETGSPMDDAADRKAGSYHGTTAVPELPAVLEFPLYAEIGRVFAGAQPTANMTYRLAKFMDPSIYPNPYATPTFIDNHDVQRFMSLGTRFGLAQAEVFLFTIPGIPVVYYGTEQLFAETRQAMFAPGFKAVRDTYDRGDAYLRLQKLAKLRKENKVFTQGALEVVYDTEAGPGVFSYQRTLAGEKMVALFNTSESKALVSRFQAGFAPGAELEVLHAEQQPPTPVVDAGGKFDLVLPPRAVLLFRPTGKALTPPSPSLTITVTTAVDGQTFTGNVTVTGSVSAPGTRLQMVLDGNLDKVTEVSVAQDGTFSVVLPVADFPIGTQAHTLAFYAPDAGVSTPRMRFVSNIVFTGTITPFSDAVGDDTGPAGKTYAYPQDGTFKRGQMDIKSIEAGVGATTMYLKVTMAEWSTVWKPPNGFDHVAFNIYFQLPGQTGVTFMPQLQASVPSGFSWSYSQFSYGWGNAMYSSNGATPDKFGTPAAPPTLSADQATKTVTFTYNRNNFAGLASWSGVKVYVTTWDYDGIGARFRPIALEGGPWLVGGGQSTDPYIMDDIAFTLP